MGVLGPNLGTTFSNDASVGTVDFSNPSNAGADDGSRATAILLLGAQSHYLKAQGFQFAVPADATVTGITVQVEHSATVSLAMVDFSTRLVKSGTIAAQDKADSSNWPTSDSTVAYGSNTDLWNSSWTPNDVNDSTFGHVISAQANVAATAQINLLTMSVAYTGSNRAGHNDGFRVKVGDGLSVSGVLG